MRELRESFLPRAGWPWAGGQRPRTPSRRAHCPCWPPALPRPVSVCPRTQGSILGSLSPTHPPCRAVRPHWAPSGPLLCTLRSPQAASSLLAGHCLVLSPARGPPAARVSRAQAPKEICSACLKTAEASIDPFCRRDTEAPGGGFLWVLQSLRPRTPSSQTWSFCGCRVSGHTGRDLRGRQRPAAPAPHHCRRGGHQRRTQGPCSPDSSGP